LSWMRLPQLTGFFRHLPRVWQLRHNFSAYEAAYIALTEKLGAALVTRDIRLACPRPCGTRGAFLVCAGSCVTHTSASQKRAWPLTPTDRPLDDLKRSSATIVSTSMTCRQPARTEVTSTPFENCWSCMDSNGARGIAMPHPDTFFLEARLPAIAARDFGGDPP
jgi:hypothetical protein